MAELEIYHSRSIAPTRRVALGERHLPVDPPPGFGGILLGGIVADSVPLLDPDLVPDLVLLTNQLEQGRRVPQPRLRHRLQVDTVGLQRSRHRLVGDGERLEFDLDVQGNAAQQVLGAVYAAGELPQRQRKAVMAAIRRAVGWTGPIGPDLIATLAGFGQGRALSASAFGDPVGWALGVLGFTNGERNGERNGAGPSRKEIQRRFRVELRAAHPDHGAATDTAAQRIADLSEARRILLG